MLVFIALSCDEFLTWVGDSITKIANPSLFLFIMTDHETLIKVIKMQAEVFLLETHEFFPFGTCIGRENEVIPIAAYLEDENDRQKSEPLIEMLERGIKRGMDSGFYKTGALAFDVFIHENNRKFDGMIVKIYESDGIQEIQFKYYIHKDYVEFV